ncbi:MAG: hypothetical protein GX592_10870 [Clostridiales bacterium]|nr:hypothetical protein [Clostridiales bacterium]
MKLTKEQADTLTGTPFADAFDRDPELAALRAQLFDADAELAALCSLFGTQAYRLGSRALKPLTAAAWSALWIAGNPLANGGTPEFADLESFFHAVSVAGFRPGPYLSNIAAASRGIVAASFPARTDPRKIADDAAELAETIIRDAFAPLAVLPADPGRSSDASPDFGASWLASIAILMHRAAGIDPIDAWTMPLSAVCSFCAAEARRNAPNGRFERPPKSETARAMLARAAEIVRNLTAPPPSAKET